MSEYQSFEGRPFTEGRIRVAVVTTEFAGRTFYLIREMASQFDVVLLSFADRNQPDVEPLLVYCSRIFLVKKPTAPRRRWPSLIPAEVAEFQVPEMHGLIADVRRELNIAVVQIESAVLTPYGGDVLVLDDVRRDSWKWRRFEQRWISRYRRIVVTSEADRKRLDRPNVTVIPNGVDLDCFRPEAEGQDARILLLGPTREFTDSNLLTVADPKADQQRLLLDGLAMQRAVIATSSGCAQLGLTHGENVWIADSAEEVRDGVIKLLQDDALRHRMAAEGRLHVESHFDWRQIGAAQRAMILQVSNPAFEFRPAAEADVDQIWAIQSTAPEASQWHREDYLAFDCTVAWIDSRIAGFLVSRETAPREREILNIAVHPDYRRLGVATKLIRRELALHPSDHFLEVRESNTSARTLYSRLGFRDVGIRPGYYENPPEAGIVMRYFS